MRGKSLGVLAGASLAILLASVAGALLAQEQRDTPYLDYQAPEIYRQWRTSDDGRVSICLAVKQTTFSAAAGEVTLYCAMRNNTDTAMTVLKPFGDDFFTQASGLCVVGPDGVLEYEGPQKDYMLGDDAYLELPPRSVVEGSATIEKQFRPSIDRPGLYVVDYGHYSKRHPAPANFWTGTLDSNPVTLMVKE